ncbi:hypothetical protein C8Q76DRAFT_637083, partial [Earliella scabrosa]
MGHSQRTTHVVRRRVIWVVPVILGDRIPRHDRGEEEREQWAKCMLILFRSWRKPGDLKCSTETWIQAYERQSHLLTDLHKSVISNINSLSECRDARDRVNRARR